MNAPFALFGGSARTNWGQHASAVLDDLPLILGVSTRALFDLEDEHLVFLREGEEAHRNVQREREFSLLHPGCAFEFIKQCLDLNPSDGSKLVEVVLLSRSGPDQAMRAFELCKLLGWTSPAAASPAGQPMAPYAAAWGVDLMLSNDDEDVRTALNAGVAAARFGAARGDGAVRTSNEIVIALDGDAVVFGDEFERMFHDRGLAEFQAQERDHSSEPLSPGPFARVLRKLVRLRARCRDLTAFRRWSVTASLSRSGMLERRSGQANL